MSKYKTKYTVDLKDLVSVFFLFSGIFWFTLFLFVMAHEAKTPFDVVFGLFKLVMIAFYSVLLIVVFDYVWYWFPRFFKKR